MAHSHMNQCIIVSWICYLRVFKAEERCNRLVNPSLVNTFLHATVNKTNKLKKTTCDWVGPITDITSQLMCTVCTKLTLLRI